MTQVSAVPLQAAPGAPVAPLDLERVRADFPILALKVKGRPLAYLDNAASSQMPQAVLERLEIGRASCRERV